MNEWGEFCEEINNMLNSEDTTELNKFTYYFESTFKFKNEYIFKDQGILAQFRKLNDVEEIKRSLGNYLLTPFKYESKDRDFIGVKFETGRWFSRNLKIFRNIQRIPVNENDRILVIYGSDHMNLLNIFFDASPEYDLVNTNDYLK